jgi:N utilization substance protein B
MAAPKPKGSPKARRAAARLAAVQVLYQMRLNHQDAPSALKEFITDRSGKKIDGAKMITPDEETLDAIVRGVQERWADIDAVLAKTLADGKREKVEVLLECILRAGISELLSGGTDIGIIINDYLNVTASFYDGHEPKLVNAILDKVAKSVRS